MQHQLSRATSRLRDAERNRSKKYLSERLATSRAHGTDIGLDPDVHRNVPTALLRARSQKRENGPSDNGEDSADVQKKCSFVNTVVT